MTATAFDSKWPNKYTINWNSKYKPLPVAEIHASAHNMNSRYPNPLRHQYIQRFIAYPFARQKYLPLISHFLRFPFASA